MAAQINKAVSCYTFEKGLDYFAKTKDSTVTVKPVVKCCTFPRSFSHYFPPPLKKSDQHLINTNFICCRNLGFSDDEINLNILRKIPLTEEEATQYFIKGCSIVGLENLFHPNLAEDGIISWLRSLKLVTYENSATAVLFVVVTLSFRVAGLLPWRENDSLSQIFSDSYIDYRINLLVKTLIGLVARDF